MIRPKFDKDFVSRLTKQHVENLETALVNRFIRVGLQFVRLARKNGAYRDQTGNLRSSIGFIVLKGTQIVYENFEPAGRGATTPKYSESGKKRGANATIQGRNAAKDAMGRVKLGGVTLVVVAGMDYASDVEHRGKDVLTASSLQAEKLLLESIQKVRTKYNF